MPDRILNVDAVAELVGVRPATVNSMRRKGGFPDPVGLGARKVGWRLSDVERWIAERPVAKVVISKPTLDGRAAFWARVRRGEAVHPRTAARLAREAAEAAQRG